MRLGVWAPHARSVDVHLESRGLALPMQQQGGGWWAADAQGVEHGEEYRFSLDGAAPLPDPRSAWQPRGVHGPSAVVDHSRYAWTDGSWRGVHLPSEVLYEVHVGTFSESGTFEGAIAHLDHVVSLGAGVIELMPVAEFPGERGWGYDGVDMFAPHHLYGGPEGLKLLVDEAHSRGIGVFLDVVYNHLGPDGNYLGRFGPYFSERYQTPWGAPLNLDGPGSDEVRRFVIDNALSWLRNYHLDGLRLDAVHSIVDLSATHILEELSSAVESLSAELGRKLWLVAESDQNDPRLLRPRQAFGYGLDAQWSDDFHHALWAVLTRETQGYYRDFGALSQLAGALERAWVYEGQFSPHRDRRHGRPSQERSGGRYVTYLQNHDQVGNRAKGERVGHLATDAAVAVATGLLCCSPFVPLCFQGEEWAAGSPFQYFCDHEDPDLAAAVSEGRRHEFAAFGWGPEDVPDPGELSTFLRSRLDWSELGRPGHAEAIGWWRRLIDLRRRCAWLSDGSLDGLEARADEEAGLLLVRRGPGLVAANFGDRPALAAVPRGSVLLVSSVEGVRLSGEEMSLPAVSFAVAGPPLQASGCC